MMQTQTSAITNVENPRWGLRVFPTVCDVLLIPVNTTGELVDHDWVHLLELLLLY